MMMTANLFCILVLVSLLLAPSSFEAAVYTFQTIEFYLVYHYQDSDLLTAARYAANRIVESTSSILQAGALQQKTTADGSSSSPAMSYYEAAVAKPRTANTVVPKGVPKLVFRQVATDFDNFFKAADEICKLLQSNKLLILLGYRLEHLALLRTHSRRFRIPLILLDTGLDRASELLSLQYDETQQKLVHQELTTLNDSSTNSADQTAGSTGGETPSLYELQFGLPYANAVYKIIEQKGYKAFVAIYDTEDGLRRLHAIFKRLSAARKIVETEIRQIRYGEEHEVVDEMRYFHRDMANFLIDIRNSTLLTRLTKKLKENDLLNNEQIDYLFAGLNFDSDLEDVIRPLLSVHGKSARIAGFHVMTMRVDQHTAPINDIASVHKVLRDWRNLDPQSFPGAGTGRLSANQAFAIDFVTTLANVLKRWLANDPVSFAASLHDRRSTVIATGVEAGRCMGRHVSALDVGPDLVRRLRSATLSRSQTLTGPVQFNEQGERIGYSFSYYGQENYRAGFRRLGRYSDKAGFHYITVGEDKRTRNTSRHDGNHTRIVTTIGVEPFLKLKDDHQTRIGNDKFEGYIVDLTQAIAELARIKYEIRLVGDNAYGSQNATGHWNGMVGEVIYGIADMAIAPLTITAQREKIVDFTKPFMTLGISIQIKKPQKTKPSVFSFLDPLSVEIWFCIGFAYIGVSVVLFLVSRFSPYEWCEDETATNNSQAGAAGCEQETTIIDAASSRRNSSSQKQQSSDDKQTTPSTGTRQHQRKKHSLSQLQNKKFTNDFTFFNALWFSLGAFMHQDVDISPRCVSGRIVGSVWWFFTLIIISSYTANLAAFLTVERMLAPIESAEDLAKQTDIKYGTLRRGSTASFFQSSKYSVYQRMWAFMYSAEPPVFVDTIDDGIRRVRKSNGKYAFLLESTMNEYINSRNPCDTMKVGTNLDAKGYGVATAKGSDLKDLINLAVLELREKGILHSLEKKWWVEKGQCGDTADTQRKDHSQNALTLPKVAGVFYILIGGLSLAMVISLCEFLYRAKIDSHKQDMSTLGKIARRRQEAQLIAAATAAASGEGDGQVQPSLGLELENQQFVPDRELGKERANLLAQSSIAIV